MEKNYYDILEINKNASPEIIDKAYKTLVKKYHPDLQDNNLKYEYEEKIKLINEAFEVLSNKEKKKNYDLNLKSNEISIEDYDNLINENLKLKKEINYLKNNQNLNNDFSENSKENYNEAINKAYYDAYIQDLKNKGYKIRYKKTFKDYLKSLISIFITFIIFLLIFQIPFIKNYFLNNEFIKIFIENS